MQCVSEGGRVERSSSLKGKRSREENVQQGVVRVVEKGSESDIRGTVRWAPVWNTADRLLYTLRRRGR